jgi:hypothetical protein
MSWPSSSQPAAQLGVLRAEPLILRPQFGDLDPKLLDHPSLGHDQIGEFLIRGTLVTDWRVVVIPHRRSSPATRGGYRISRASIGLWGVVRGEGQQRHGGPRRILEVG